MALKNYIVVILLLIVQENLTSQDYLSRAQLAYDSGKFITAINNYNLYPQIETDKNAISQRGLAYFQLNNLSKAMQDFTMAKKLGNKSPGLYLKMAQAKQHNYDYEEASFFYKEFLKEVDDGDINKSLAYKELKNCIFSAMHDKPTSKILVQSFGDSVNTSYDEIQAIQSPRFGNVFYFSTNKRNGDFDIDSYLINPSGQWEEQEAFKNAFVSNHDELIQDIHADGNSLVYLEQLNLKEKKQAFINTYHKDEKIVIPLPENIFGKAIDIQLVNNSTILFASNQLQGQGGYDLYSVEYFNGHWSNPQNLGPEINSMHDERSPFMSSDQTELYFSSNKPYCFGGYDIYYNDMSEKSTASKLLDNSINSPGNDLGFRLDIKGHMAVFYSDRKTGKGGYDIYFAYMQDINPLAERDSVSLKYVQDYIEKMEIENIKKEQALALKAQKKKQEEFTKKIDNPEKEKDKNVKQEVGSKLTVEELNSEELIIFYQDNQDLFNNINKSKLDKCLLVLSSDPSLKLKLIAHTDLDEPGLPEFIHYNTMKRAVLISEYLFDNGLQKSKISIESVVGNFPIAKYEVAGEKNEKYLHLNKRIEIEIISSKGSVLKEADYDSFDIPPFAFDRKLELFKDIREEVYYSVEIGYSERIFKNAVLRLYNDIYSRKELSTPGHRFYIGLYNKFSDALNLKKELEKSSAPYAKVVAFYNGSIITPLDFDALKAAYPDLSNYILSRDH